jgi:biotin-(acetyl-CoA carboxylase) ligase
MGLPLAGGPWKKLAGLLCESSGPWIFVGIGINILKKSYPESLNQSATSVEEVVGPSHDADSREALMMAVEKDHASLLFAIETWSKVYFNSADWKDRYESLMWARGCHVDFLAGHPCRNQRTNGIIEGVDDVGNLLIRGERGELSQWSSGEVTGIRLS